MSPVFYILIILMLIMVFMASSFAFRYIGDIAYRIAKKIKENISEE